MQVCLQKLPGGALVPVGPDAEWYLSTLPAGAGIEFEVQPVMDMRLHRKFFALVALAFDHWQPNDDLRIDGMSLREDLKTFRKKLLILAGHYDATFHRDGSVTLKAKSISVAKCDALTLARVYQSALAVVWERVLIQARYPSAQEVDRVVDELLTYA